MPEQLRRLRQLQQTVELLSQQLNEVKQTIDAEITDRENVVADEEARRRRRRFRILGVIPIPFAGLAAAVRRRPRVATGVGATVLAAAATLAVILGMPNGDRVPGHRPPSGTPAPTPTARPTPSRPAAPAPSGRPPAAASSTSAPARPRQTVTARPVSGTVPPSPAPTSSPRPTPVYGTPQHCPIDVRRPMTLRLCRS